MISFEDVFLYELARSHQQELLQSVRPHALAASEPRSIGDIVRAFGGGLRRRRTAVTKNRERRPGDTAGPRKIAAALAACGAHDIAETQASLASGDPGSRDPQTGAAEMYAGLDNSRYAAVVTQGHSRGISNE